MIDFIYNSVTYFLTFPFLSDLVFIFLGVAIMYLIFGIPKRILFKKGRFIK